MIFCICINLTELPFLSDDKNGNDAFIDSSFNLDIYDAITQKYRETIFKYRINSPLKLLEKGRPLFANLDAYRQAKIIITLLQLNNVSGGVDLTLIGGKAKSGSIKLNKKISDKNEFTLINRSVTGIFEEKIDLLTI